MEKIVESLRMLLVQACELKGYLNDVPQETLERLRKLKMVEEDEKKKSLKALRALNYGSRVELNSKLFSRDGVGPTIIECSDVLIFTYPNGEKDYFINDEDKWYQFPEFKEGDELFLSRLVGILNYITGKWS